MSEILRLEGEFGGRLLAQHVLVGERIALVDTGAAGTPAKLILPALDRAPDYVICTHPDTDHQGGNGAIRAAAPRCRFIGHRLDARWLESPATMIAERYANEPAESYPWLAEQTGDGVALDLQVVGGERLALSHDWSVELLHTPGHSAGHLSVWDERSATLIVADAVLGAVVPDLDGHAAEAPTYTHPKPYLETIEALRAIPFERLLATHFLEMDRDAGLAFLDVSERTARAIGELVAASSDATLDALVAVADERFGPLPADARMSWAMPLEGHLRELRPR